MTANKFKKRIEKLEETIHPKCKPFNFLAMFSEEDQEAIRNAKSSPEMRKRVALLVEWSNSRIKVK